MDESELQQITKPPIVEAVVDIDCDLPPTQVFEALEKPAEQCFGRDYPEVQRSYLLEHEIETKRTEVSRTATRRGLDAYQFRNAERNQLVQVRTQGYSFNRLAPYTSLDDYLPEIERTWHQFVTFASPVRVRAVRLQYINRLMLPLTRGAVELDEYLKVGPRLPDPERLRFAGFLNQYVAVEVETGHEVRVILTAEPVEQAKLPVVFTIIAGSGMELRPGDWQGIRAKIQMLRELKNRVFHDTLTEQCLKLFQ